MTRKTNASYSKKRRGGVLKLAKGFFGNKSKLFTYAKDAVFRAKKYQYFDRKKKKSVLRSSWIKKINSSLKLIGLKYNFIIFLFNKFDIAINRSSLSILIENEPTLALLYIKSIFQNGRYGLL